jgi:DNA-binding CsgD family transcriptional regulator
MQANPTPEAAVAFDASIGALATTIASVGHGSFAEDLCALLQTLTGCPSIAIIAFSEPGRPQRLFDNLTRRDQKRSLDPYLAGAYLLDPWYDMLLRHVPDGVYLLTEHTPDDFWRSEYFRDYYARTGLRSECGMFVRLSMQACIVISLGLYGDASADIDLRAAQTLFPCIRELCLRHWGASGSETVQRSPSLEELCRLKGLSGREGQVTAMLLRGYANKRIASELRISPETVKVYRKRINRKLGTCSSREIFSSFFTVSAGLRARVI